MVLLPGGKEVSTDPIRSSRNSRRNKGGVDNAWHCAVSLLNGALAGENRVLCQSSTTRNIDIQCIK